MLNISKAPTIQEVAKVTGKIIVSFPGVMHSPLYHRELQKNKTQVLKVEKRNFEVLCHSRKGARIELHW